MRRANWRALPEDPRTLWGWMALDDGPRLRDWRWVVFLCLVIVVLAYSWSPFALLAAPLLALHCRFRKLPHGDLTPYRTLPAPGPVADVRLSVERGSANAVIGVDRGVVTFVDGWLHYAGLRTEFSLRAKDVLGFSASAANVRLLLQNVTVEVTGLSDGMTTDLGRAARFWYESSTTEGEDSVMPPDTVHSSGMARAWAMFITRALKALGFSVGVSLAMDFIYKGSGAVIVGTVGAGVLGDSLSKLNALHQLRKKEKKSLSNVSKPAIGP